MKERLKKIYHVNTGWWDSFTSCLVGTLLGIAVTFGVTYLDARKEDKATERKIQIITVRKMEQAISSIGSRVEAMKESDSVFVEVLDYWEEDRLDGIPRDLVAAFYGKLMEVSIQSRKTVQWICSEAMWKSGKPWIRSPSKPWKVCWT